MAERLRAEFALITGQELRLFVDRDDIAWGEEWRERIETALVRTTFFIPVLTPRYFTRDECRKELLDFVGQAQGLGVAELILPVLYVDVPDFSDDNSDEAVALASRMQYQDWTDIRLCAEDSQEHRRAVNALARRLAEVATTVAARQVVQEGRVANDDQAAGGFGDVLDAMGQLLPAWLEAVETDPVLEVQLTATYEKFDEMLRKARQHGAGSRFALEQRRIAELMPLAERQLALSEIYSARTIALNPLVARATKLVNDHPERMLLLADLEAAVNEATSHIRAAPEPGQMYARHWARRNEHVSRAMGRLATIWEKSDKLRNESNAIVQTWQNELRQLNRNRDAT